MRRFSAIMTAVALFSYALASAFSQAPQQSQASGIDAIMAYAGTWKVQGERFATAHSNSGKEDTTLRNECWKTGAYVVCNQFVNGESKTLLIFTYNDKQKMYTAYHVMQDGDPAGSGRLQIIGNVWTFPWQVTEAGDTIYFHVVNVFTDADHIQYQQEFSTDNLHWTTMAKGSETRIGN